jgi:hypothetical protein
MTAFRMGIPGEWLASVAQSHAEILVLQIFSSSSFLTVPATRPHFSGCLDLEGDRGDLELVLVLSFKHKKEYLQSSSSYPFHTLSEYIISANRASLHTSVDCTTSYVGTQGSVQHKTGISIRFRARLGVPALKPPRNFCAGIGALRNCNGISE